MAVTEVRTPSDAAAPAMSGAQVRPTLPSRRRTAALLAGVAFCMLWPFPSYEQINNPNENVRFYMSVAMVEDGSYQIDGPWRRWGWVNDAAELAGRHYSVKAPLTSWLGAPAYAAYLAFCEATGRAPQRLEALWATRVLASILPWLLCLYALHRWLGRWTSSPLLRDALWLTLALGSLLYGYSLILTSHTLAAACSVGALMLLAQTPARPRPEAGSQEPAVAAPGLGWRRAGLAGLLAAGATAAEYPAIVASVPLTLLAAWVLRTLPDRLGFLCGAALPTLGVMHFQWSAFGHPLRPGHLFLENKAFAAIHAHGVYGADGFYPEAAGGLLFDPGFGLFPLSPLLLPALVGMVWLARPPRHDALFQHASTRSAARTAAVIAALGWLTTSMLMNWRGGWTIGPRYLAPFVPLCGLAALVALEQGYRRFPRATEGFAVGALAVGLMASAWPSAYYPHIPEAIVRPLPQLMVPLWRQGLVPRNAGQWLGLEGNASMAPWALALLLLFAAVVTSASWPKLPLPLSRKLLMAGPIWSVRLLIGAIVAAALGMPLWALPRQHDAAAVAREVAFITRTWSPAVDRGAGAAEAADPGHRRPSARRR